MFNFSKVILYLKSYPKLKKKLRYNCTQRITIKHVLNLLNRILFSLCLLNLKQFLDSSKETDTQYFK